MGYPVGYLKYPEGVERMAFEVVKARLPCDNSKLL